MSVLEHPFCFLLLYWGSFLVVLFSSLFSGRGKWECINLSVKVFFSVFMVFCYSGCSDICSADQRLCT